MVSDILCIADEESVRVSLAIFMNEVLRLNREINTGEEMKMRVLTEPDSSANQGKLNFNEREITPTTVNTICNIMDFREVGLIGSVIKSGLGIDVDKDVVSLVVQSFEQSIKQLRLIVGHN